MAVCYADGLVELRSSSTLALIVSMTRELPFSPLAARHTSKKMESATMTGNDKGVPTLALGVSPNEAMIVTADWFGKLRFFSLLDYLIKAPSGIDEGDGDLVTALSQRVIRCLLSRDDWWDLVFFIHKVVRDQENCDLLEAIEGEVIAFFEENASYFPGRMTLLSLQYSLYKAVPERKIEAVDSFTMMKFQTIIDLVATGLTDSLDTVEIFDLFLSEQVEIKSLAEHLRFRMPFIFIFFFFFFFFLDRGKI